MIPLNNASALGDASRPKPGSFAASLRASATPIRRLCWVQIRISVIGTVIDGPFRVLYGEVFLGPCQFSKSLIEKGLSQQVAQLRLAG